MHQVPPQAVVIPSLTEEELAGYAPSAAVSGCCCVPSLTNVEPAAYALSAAGCGCL